jgi:hypothetical protein
MTSDENNEGEIIEESAPMSSESQGSDDYAEFDDFGVGQWIEWLNAFLSNAPHSPLIATNKEELHHSLLDLYRGLGNKPKRDSFAEAIKLIFETTQRIGENKEQLYYLLHIIIYTVPLNAKWLLRQRLHESVLNNIEYGHQNLQTLLLIANSKYEVDDDLVDYVHRSARVSRDYRHLLASLRILALRGGQEAYPFIEYFLPFITSEAKSFQLARQLRSIGQRIGYKHFFEWYTRRSEELAKEWHEHWYFFERGLKERLFTEQTFRAISNSDPYAGFLTGYVYASLHELTPSTVLGIARLFKIAGKEYTITHLCEIWNKGNEKWRSGPWEFLTPEESLERDRAAITTDGSVADYREEFFDPDEEDELEEVFLEVRDRCDSTLARESVAMAAGA